MYLNRLFMLLIATLLVWGTIAFLRPKGIFAGIKNAREWIVLIVILIPIFWLIFQMYFASNSILNNLACA